MNIPKYTDLRPDKIVENKRHFCSSWHAFQSLAWLDYARKCSNYSALQYSALELRLGVELVWYETICVNAKINEQQYIRCTREATKMYKLLDELQPDYEKLVKFSKIIVTLSPEMPQFVEWDLKRLKRIYGEASNFLHFVGAPNKTTELIDWYSGALSKIETGAIYIWEKLISSCTGIMRVSEMQPEVKGAWEKFKSNQMTEKDVLTWLQLAQPTLHRRASIGKL